MKLAISALCTIFLASLAAAAEETPLPVNVANFARAETDMYFARTVADGAFGRLRHSRELAPIDRQTVVRMNRDTLYSSGVFDFDAAPVAVTLPNARTRFVSMQVISQDHYTIDVSYAPGRHTYDRAKVGTRYGFIIIRILVDPLDPADIEETHRLQDAIKVEQAATGTFEVPKWDAVSQEKARDALAALGSLGGTSDRFGKASEVKPIDHLIGTAMGWGGNPRYAADYVGGFPQQNDGTTVHTLTVRDVPVEGFWSISVYNAKGYFEKNDLGRYSLNSLTATPNADDSFTIRFGGCGKDTLNCLPITRGWNYTVRLYRPGRAYLKGQWRFPEPVPVEGSSARAAPTRPVHTFSIVARDPATGELGVAVQSHWFSVGSSVPWIEAGVGAIATQSFVDPSYGKLGLDLMRAGKSAPDALKALIAGDASQDVRQVAMIDAQGRVAAHTGSHNIAAAGHIVGKDFSVQANLMLNEKIWPAMAKAFEESKGDLADRMLAALDAAQLAGGDIRGRQSAALIVVTGTPTGKAWADRRFDLRVDDSAEPLRELRRLVTLQRAYNHMNAGDLAVEHKDDPRALAEYGAASKLVPDNAEMIYWHAVALVNMKRVEESLPLFRRAFAIDRNWVILTPRLTKVGLLPDDPKITQRIVDAAGTN